LVRQGFQVLVAVSGGNADPGDFAVLGQANAFLLVDHQAVGQLVAGDPAALLL
jgi:hypothetical protein